MLPECCVVRDGRCASTEDDAGYDTKHQSVDGDEPDTRAVGTGNGGTGGVAGVTACGDGLLFVRQNTTDYFRQNLGEENSLRDVIVISDSCLPPLVELLAHVDYSSLTGLYIVDTKVDLSGSGGGVDDSSVRLPSSPSDRLFGDHLSLRVLVLSRTRLRRLPAGVFRLAATLEVLKVDGNSLDEIPAEIGWLARLQTFVCDAQRPRLRALPTSMRRLARLRVLSFSDNRVETLTPWIVGLRELRTLRADRNRLTRLPSELGDLDRLTSLDVSHNRLDAVDPQLLDLIVRLPHFRFVGVALRPRAAAAATRDVSELAAHLELERLLEGGGERKHQQPATTTVVKNIGGGASFAVDHSVTTTAGAGGGRPGVRDLTIAVVGETNAGKRSLVEALRSERGVCCRRPETKSSTTSVAGGDGVHRHSPLSATAGYDVCQLDLYSIASIASAGVSGASNGTINDDDDCNAGGGGFGSMTYHVNVVVMANDFLDGFTRDVDVDLYLLAVDLTSLELQRNGGAASQQQHLFSRHLSRLRMWLRTIYELNADVPVVVVGTHAELVNQKAAPFGSIWHAVEALLDRSRGDHSRRYAETPAAACLLCSAKNHAVRHPHVRTRPTSAGYVDLSLNDVTTTSSTTTTTTRTGGVSEFTSTNGYIPIYVNDCGNGAGDDSPTENFRFPHIVGYYEVDSKKPFPKDGNNKKSNVGIDALRAAVVRHATTVGLSVSCGSTVSRRVPPSWVTFVRNLATLSDRAPSIAFLPTSEIVAIARSFEISAADVPHLLRYFHRRGRLVFFGGGDAGTADGDDELLSKIVVINPTWFVRAVGRFVDGLDRSVVSFGDMLEALVDRDLDRVLQKAGVVTDVAASTSGRWLLAALRRLEVCVSFYARGHLDDQIYLVPTLLEYGSPSQDVWPEAPDWDEKQITCHFSVRRRRSAMFSTLVLAVVRYGRRRLQILAEPVPIFLAHHIVFFTGMDSGGCEDCFRIRRRMRQKLMKNDDRGGGGDNHNHHHYHHRHISDSVHQAAAAAVAAEEQDDIIHKVHITMNAKMSALTIQIRGPSPCCTMKALLAFLEQFFDDRPDDDFFSTDMATTTGCSSDDGATMTVSARWPTPAPPRSMATTGSASCYSGSRASLASGSDQDDAVDDAGDRELYILCPKCVLLRQSHPERIAYPCGLSSRRRAICSKWHNLGSWTRVATGDYRFTSLVDVTPAAVAGSGGSAGGGILALPDHEHPRLALVLPPSAGVSTDDWYLRSRLRFLEGFEVHFLCEYTGYWHRTSEPGYRLAQSARFVQKIGAGGDQLPAILQLGLRVVQCFQGAATSDQNGRLLAPVAADLVETYDYLRPVDRALQADPVAWLAKHKDRVVNMLGKVLTNAGGGGRCGLTDVYSRGGGGGATGVDAEAVFRASTPTGRSALARFLRLDVGSGRFGALRPVYFGREVRWVCEAHYEELRSMPCK